MVPLARWVPTVARPCSKLTASKPWTALSIWSFLSRKISWIQYHIPHSKNYTLSVSRVSSRPLMLRNQPQTSWKIATTNCYLKCLMLSNWLRYLMRQSLHWKQNERLCKSSSSWMHSKRSTMPTRLRSPDKTKQAQQNERKLDTTLRSLIDYHLNACMYSHANLWEWHKSLQWKTIYL